MNANDNVFRFPDLPKPFRCSICDERIVREFGDNAWPVNDGTCCTDCNTGKVVPARLAMTAKRRTKDGR